MHKVVTTIILLLFCSCTFSQVKTNFNGDFEQVGNDHIPIGWRLGSIKGQAPSYSMSLDSVVKHGGKYSLSLTKIKDGAPFGSAMYIIPQTFKGKQIQFKGFLKTDQVVGNAGLWLRIDGSEGSLAFDNMFRVNISGTRDWQEYTINLPYDDTKALKIYAGALLSGSGKIWVDDLRLYIDDKPIEKTETKQLLITRTETDTTYLRKSGIDTVMTNQQTVENLKILAQVWGFLKYYHPAIAKGDFNMDAELFKVMPSVIKATSYVALSNVIESWVDKFGVPPVCEQCKPLDVQDALQLPNYGSIFDQQIFSSSLIEKLKYILNNRNTGENIYVILAEGINNPLFQHEQHYAYLSYPDAGIRLLCLFRYWNMIQYFYPYKHLIGRDWNGVLTEFIPQFIKSANVTDYDVTTLKLICNIHDTHADLGSSLTIANYMGKYRLPFQAKFIEDKFVVTGYYFDTLNVKEKFKLGDVITSINGISVNELIKKYLPLTAGSNYATQLRDMPGSFLLRGNNPNFKLAIIRDRKASTVDFNGIETSKADFYSLDWNPGKNLPGYYLINNQIGYLFPGRYSNDSLPKIKALFKNTKGIIVDMRCYPSDFMPFSFVPYIKSGNADFAKFTNTSLAYPGLFTATKPLGVNGTEEYKGKVVVIVNEITQSQAEYTTMAFQASSNVTVIGSTTAGADGNTSPIYLPGNLITVISGIGVLYPDGTETQRKGVKIDYVIKPTINGIKARKDELLEKAEQLINEH
jgi:hypothetical protein